MSCDPSCACGCCQGVAPATPEPVANRPGLSRLSRRVGRWATFLETLQARLSSQDLPELERLTTRAPDDFSLGRQHGQESRDDRLAQAQTLADRGHAELPGFRGQQVEHGQGTSHGRDRALAVRHWLAPFRGWSNRQQSCPPVLCSALRSAPEMGLTTS